MPSLHPVHFLRAMLVLIFVNCHRAPTVAGFVTLLDNVGRFSIVDTDTGIANMKAFGLGGYTNPAFNWHFGRCQARMALYAWGQSANSLAARGRFLLYFRELWQLMMTSQTCLG